MGELLHIANEITNAATNNISPEIVLCEASTANLTPKAVRLCFFNEEEKNKEVIARWFGEINAEETKIKSKPLIDGSTRTRFMYKNIKVIVYWHTYNNLSEFLQRIFTYELLEHEAFLRIWELSNSKTLKSTGKLDILMNQIKDYPPSLSNMVIAKTLNEWPKPIDKRIDLLYKSDSFDKLTKLSIEDIKFIIRLLYAVNCRWDAPWKLVEKETNLMNIKPYNFINKMNEIIVNFNNPALALIQNYKLSIEVLDVIQSNSDINLPLDRAINDLNHGIKAINEQFNITQ